MPFRYTGRMPSTIKHIRISDQEEALCGEQMSVDDFIPSLVSSEYVLDHKVGNDPDLCGKCLEEFEDEFIGGHFEGTNGNI